MMCLMSVGNQDARLDSDDPDQPATHTVRTHTHAHTLHVCVYCACFLCATASQIKSCNL